MVCKVLMSNRAQQQWGEGWREEGRGEWREGRRGGGRKAGLAKGKVTVQLSNHCLHGDPSSHGGSDLNDTFPPQV